MDSRHPGVSPSREGASEAPQFTASAYNKPAHSRGFPYGNQPHQQQVSLNFARPMGAPPYLPPRHLELVAAADRRHNPGDVQLTGPREDSPTRLRELMWGAGNDWSRGVACVFCGCTDSHACLIPLNGFDASGRPYTRADVEACSWISRNPPVCSAPPCRAKLAERDELAPLSSFTPLDRIADVMQLLKTATRGPSAGTILSAASYDAILEQLQLAAEEVSEMQLELQSIGDAETIGTPSLFREVLARVADRRAAESSESPYAVAEPQADGAR